MGEKGTKLNKCLCKAHVCGITMVTVPNFRGGQLTKMSAAARDLYDEVVSSELFSESYRAIVTVLSLWSFDLLRVRLTAECCLCCF